MVGLLGGSVVGRVRFNPFIRLESVEDFSAFALGEDGYNRGGSGLCSRCNG